MKRYIAILGAMSLCAGAFAQEINPTVEVTNDYQGKTVEAVKPSQKMDVPDSVLRFDMKYDYDIFTQKYAGAADFTPYLMDMKPTAQIGRGKKLYLRAGAGFPLKPTLDLVFTPVQGTDWNVDFYAFHRSYIGKYRNIGLEQNGDLYDIKAIKDISGSSEKKYVKGYDALTRVGVDLHKTAGSTLLSLSAGYYGIHTKVKDDDDNAMKTGFNSAEASFGFSRATTPDTKYFLYEGTLRGRFGSEKLTGGDEVSTLGEFKASFDGTFGPVFSRSHRIVADVHAGVSSYSNLCTATLGNFYVTPKYVFERGGARISLGVKINPAFRGGDTFYYGFEQGATKGQIFYPDVHVSMPLAPGVNLYGKVTGGVTLNDYSSLKEWNHFVTPWRGVFYPLMENTIERVNFTGGLRGNVSEKFRYDVSAGYGLYKNMLSDAAYAFYDGTYMMIAPMLSYVKGGVFHADASLAYDGDPFFAEASLAYRKANVTDDEFMAFAPAALSGNLHLGYNIRNRLTLGLYGDFATKRTCTVTYEDYAYGDMTIPGYFDLGIGAEYAVNRKLSVWARGGNLLNQTIMKHICNPEYGISITAGIVLSL